MPGFQTKSAVLGVYMLLWKESFVYNCWGPPRKTYIIWGAQADSALIGPPSPLVNLRGPSSVQIIEFSPCFWRKKTLCIY